MPYSPFSTHEKLILVLIKQVITINGMFPGPLINATTNDIIHVNVFNNMDEPLLFTWYFYIYRYSMT